MIFASALMGALALVTLCGTAWGLLEVWALFPRALPTRHRVAAAAGVAVLMLFPPGLGAVVMATLGHALDFEPLATMMLRAAQDEDDEEDDDG